ncbi:uncharacterized protein PGTG_14408 [Puccinia graminis f. sp. tritici CRL 75-36-700-3]|uniref:Uncharacterized protein n=1 Tax=Puccinia graminis f. sp. tritici (strain CRL 75-36-700-3 / race SCCL) TaxID=418459 RepID=E3KVI4_PUCGT|nr:uncharacterized protein PGTG_14408 [Puccinia graminis f. sp. tritici CRL 75-36-700-3]EFP88324.2 hypothetical protein PGTG_14408 [Puccinia graminis f. sp. tritici CRL 75-36-700-3]
MSVVVSSDSASEYRGSDQSYSPAPDTPGPRTRATTQSSNRESHTGANRPTVHRSHGTSDQTPSPAPDPPGPRTRLTTQSTNREPQSGPVRPTVRRTHGAGGRLPAGPQRGASTRAAAGPGRGASRPRPANLPGVPSRARATALSTRQATAVQPTGNEADPQGAWPPARVHLTVDDEPINDQFVSEVDAIFQLGGSYADLGEQLAYVPLPRQYVVGIYGLLSVRQAIERLRQDILNAPHGPGAASAEVSMASQAQNFHYVAVFSDYVTRQARELLMSRNLGVYSSEAPRGAPRKARGLLTLVLEKINEQSDEFKMRYLPRGYSVPDPAAQGSVTTYVRGKLRNSRGKMRDLLLTNIDMKSELPVPTISSLLTLMRSSLIPPLPNNAPATDTTEKGRREYGLLKARVAYLRLQTIINYIRQGGESNRQWKNIDEHLRDLAYKSREYRSVFYQLVTRYDRKIFGGEEVFSNIDRDSISLPTHEEIEALVASNSAVNVEAEGDPGEDV